MAYRRRAPAAQTLTPAQQLAKLCNSYAGDLVFQSHNAMALLSQLHKHDRSQYDLFVKNATMQRFVPSWAAKFAGEEITASKFTLPLPAHYINSKETATDFEPRSFHLEKNIRDVVHRPTKGASFPRCGLTGLFYAREEVVDNLQAAATDLGFTSPFWIQKDHPGLSSGYLRLKDGSESIVISLTASIIGLGNVEPIEERKLHPSLRGLVTKDAECASPACLPDSVPVGMNALTGAITENPFVRALPNRGLWVSQDQLLQHGIKLSRRIKQAAGAFALVEIDQWELFNADQLQVPGRLGLRRSLDLPVRNAVFEPV